MKTKTLSFLLVILAACQQTGSAPKLQGHLASAKASTAQTQGSVQSAKGHLDNADYKASKIRGILDQGVERPE